MRSQIQKLKKLQIHAHINMQTQPQGINKQSSQPYNNHKSICYIHLTDFSESIKKDEKPNFRNTLYTKIGKRMSPKKNFFKTMMGKFQEISSEQKIKTGKTERKEENISSVTRQYSERSSFIIKKLNQCSKSNDRDLTQMLAIANHHPNNMQDDHLTLFQDIERLRYSENGYLHMLKNKANLSNTSVINLQIDHQQQSHRIIPKSSKIDLLDAEQIRQNREEAALRLREKIKNKQSRRHIYHSLKNKCEAWNKIRFKTQHHIKTEGSAASAIQDSQFQRLHCKQINHNARSIQAAISKPQTKPNVDGSSPLKIISKPCSISLNTFCTTAYPESPTKQMRITFTENPESLESSANRLKSKKDIYNQIITSIAKAKKESTLTKTRNGQKRQNNNQFRLLTPWQAEVDQTF